jgi:DNA polymerase-3 subunit epsilon
MLIAGSDIETTGLEPGDHRIIEAYVGLYDLSTRKLVDKYFTRIDPQRTIQPAAQAVHKIALSDLQGEPLWKDVAPTFHAILERADVDLVVGHNWRDFDGPFVDYEMVRVGLPKLTKPIFDTMQEGRFATPTGLVPNLGALCWACGIEYDASQAHAAEYDVDVMMQAFFRGLDWGFFKINQPATALAA